ncbi:recombinase family protein [Aeromonas caviae]|uniref:recombinase family protein n=1 Tax=Aeromonas caviae TaxID=648 RepID=UPI001FBBDBBA|nr:recombinase family protein [Aeromonas caviae]GKR04406.1 resolvase [Aeromonas caviae]GKR25518.1 resolvase [Aeromonas caviae]GKR29907.1 resolvase [Aeromonas caviae]GKR34212.1 resolvase [Aeromonas caviae]GKR50825.1 resolvase [Aeromonas caviae]
MSNRIYGYLRASTDEQDASRAKEQLIEFAQSQGQQIAGWFVENESGASLKRPELFRLLDIAQQGDCLLVEQVDRISRLNGEDWESLKAIIKAKGVRIVALDLPTSHQLMTTGDEFTSRMLDALNSMMLDMLAAIARKDYTDRRRQAQGIAKAKAEGRYKGRPIDAALHEKIQLALSAGWSYSKIEDMYKCSRATIAKVAKDKKI